MDGWIKATNTSAAPGCCSMRMANVDLGSVAHEGSAGPAAEAGLQAVWPTHGQRRTAVWTLALSAETRAFPATFRLGTAWTVET